MRFYHNDLYYHILVPLSGGKQRDIKTISSRISLFVPDIAFCSGYRFFVPLNFALCQNKEGRLEVRVG